MNILDLVLTLSPVIPAVAKIVAGDNAAIVAKGIVDIAEKLTGKEGKDAVEHVRDSEEYHCDFICELEHLFDSNEEKT